MKIFAMKDMKADSYNQPFFSSNAATAIRQLAMGLKENSMLTDFAADFSLYEIGLFDQATGRISATADPYHVIDISEIVKTELETVDTTPQPQLSGVA